MLFLYHRSGLWLYGHKILKNKHFPGHDVSRGDLGAKAV